MDKKSIVLLLLGLFVVTSVFATQTRMSGLGHPYGLIEDDTDVFTFPATIFKYSGVAVGELQRLSGSTEWSMSANIPIRDHNLGVYLNRDTILKDNLWGFQYPENTVHNMDISKSVEFNFGFLDNFAVGYGSSVDYESDYAYTSGWNKTQKIEPAANFHSFFGGYSANDLDIGLRLVMANVTDVTDENGNGSVDANDSYFEREYTSVAANGRKIFRSDSRTELAVKASFAIENSVYNLKELNTYDKSKEEYQSMILDLGFSLQYKPNSNNKLIFGVTPIIYNPVKAKSIEYNDSDSDKSKFEVNTLFFPKYNLAVESKITSWLAGRFGANQSQTHRIFTGNGIRFEYYDKDYYMNLGLTFTFDNFCIDSVLEQELLFDGPNFLGGKANGLASEISVKYKF